MKQIIDFFEKNQSGSLATIDNESPRVRPFGIRLWNNGRFYFSTSNTKAVYQQLLKNPVVEFAATSSDFVTSRLSGKVVFTDDIAIKKFVIENTPHLLQSYTGTVDPTFEVFYIEHGEAVISDLLGKSKRKVEF